MARFGTSWCGSSASRVKGSNFPTYKFGKFIISILKTLVHCKPKNRTIANACFSYRLKMIKKYSPLICNSTWGDHWISEDIKCNFATEMVRNLKINK